MVREKVTRVDSMVRVMSIWAATLHRVLRFFFHLTGTHITTRHSELNIYPVQYISGIFIPPARRDVLAVILRVFIPETFAYSS